MSVELQPPELGFKRPFNHEVTETLKLSNTTTSPVAFKVKTTAPKQYCVRPNSGQIPPSGSVEVQVLLQAMKEDPPLDAKCRDKFLVQSAEMSHSDDPNNLAGFWSTMEKTNKGLIQERKIRVNFLPPGGAGAAVNGTTQHEDEPPAYSSPSPQYGSPAPQSANAQATQSRAPTTTDSAKSSMANAAEATGLAGAATAIINAVPTSGEDVKQQLAAANEQIQKLSSQLADPELRQRKVKEASEKMQTVVQQSNEQGVPLQIVAGLCLLSFLIAYLFF